MYRNTNECLVQVPAVGIEPTRPHGHRILSAARLPVPPDGLRRWKCGAPVPHGMLVIPSRSFASSSRDRAALAFPETVSRRACILNSSCSRYFLNYSKRASGEI